MVFVKKQIKIHRTPTNPCLRAGVGLGLLCALLVLLSTGCAGVATVPVSGPGLTNAGASMKDLCARMLDALHQKDRETLRAISITEEEYRHIIWPQLPISKIKQWQSRYDFVWGQHMMKSGSCLEDLLVGYGGKHYSLVDVRIVEDVTDYEDYRVHRDARVIVTDDTGRKRELNLFGSIVEMHGQYKIMSYNIH